MTIAAPRLPAIAPAFAASSLIHVAVAVTLFGLVSTGRQGDGEGWYVDRFRVEIETPAPVVCDVIRWPGSIPPGSLAIDKTAGLDLVASWGASCRSPTHSRSSSMI